MAQHIESFDPIHVHNAVGCYDRAEVYVTHRDIGPKGRQTEYIAVMDGDETKWYRMVPVRDGRVVVDDEY